MSDKVVEQSVYGLLTSGPVSVDNGDDLAAWEGLNGLKDDCEPFEFLDGFVGPADESSQIEGTHLNSVLNDGQPAVVLGHLFLYSHHKSLFDWSFVFEKVDNFSVKPTDFTKLTDHGPDSVRDVDVGLELKLVGLTVLDEIGLNVLHDVRYLFDEVDLCYALLWGTFVSEWLQLLGR